MVFKHLVFTALSEICELRRIVLIIIVKFVVRNHRHQAVDKEGNVVEILVRYAGVESVTVHAKGPGRYYCIAELVKGKTSDQ